jgi:hypothetical protein
MELRPLLVSASAKPDVVIATVLVEVARRIDAYRTRLNGGCVVQSGVICTPASTNFSSLSSASSG